MREKTALFRASASPTIGGGHIIRCMALANELKNIGWSCTFACGEETPLTIPMIAEFEIIPLGDTEPENEPAYIQRMYGRSCDILIVDHYQRGLEFEKQCRQWASFIVSLDDLPNRPHDADILLDQSGGRDAKDYQHFLPEYCQLLLGPNFSLLRPQFSTEPENSGATSDLKREGLFVSMGATDTDNFTTIILSAVADNLPDIEVDIMLSAKAPHLTAVQDICSNHKNFSLHIDAPEPASIMRGSLLSIGTAGINLWERCALGIPSVIIVAAENQQANAAFVKANGGGIIIDKNSAALASEIANAVVGILDDPDKLQQMSRAANTICDGRGAKRVAKIINEASTR
jgi:UDP-2,4-diacetamido-2,4,6-trideoxy-beta-L-altropyranose hydrolase